MGRKLTGFLTILVSVLLTPFAEAAYHNPEVRVLLFSTTSGVVFSHQNSLVIENGQLENTRHRKLVVKRVRANKVMVNNQYVHPGSLWIRGNPETRVQQIGSSVNRGYLGRIEIKPFAKGLYVINHVPIEHYLEGVLNAEISTKWHMEVIKAQSVIARTFALYKMEKRGNAAWHLSAGQYDQVYLGVDIADDRGKRAIGATRGIVVSFNGKLAQTFYHSNCGGMTEDPGYIWRTSLPYLRVKSVPYGQKDPRYHWETTLSEKELLTLLRKSGENLNSVKKLFINKQTSSKRAFELVFVGKRPVKMLAYKFRKLAGYRRIQSLLFDVIKVPGGFHFRGKGNGHGVGLSQWAAKEMAEVGYKYHDIIYFFYSGIRLKIYRS